MTHLAALTELWEPHHCNWTCQLMGFNYQLMYMMLTSCTTNTPVGTATIVAQIKKISQILPVQ